MAEVELFLRASWKSLVQDNDTIILGAFSVVRRECGIAK